jgi:hypothetical protein
MGIATQVSLLYTGNGYTLVHTAFTIQNAKIPCTGPCKLLEPVAKRASCQPSPCQLLNSYFMPPACLPVLPYTSQPMPLLSQNHRSTCAAATMPAFLITTLIPPSSSPPPPLCAGQLVPAVLQLL